MSNAWKALVPMLIAGVTVGVAGFMVYKQVNDEETYKPLTDEDIAQKKKYFNKIIKSKEILLTDEMNEGSEVEPCYSMKFIKEFFDTIIEGSVVPFRNITKEYREHRRIVAEKSKTSGSKKDMAVLISDFDKRYQDVIATVSKNLIESLELDQQKFELTIDILLQSNPEFKNFYDSIVRILLRRCVDRGQFTNVSDQEKVFVYLKFLISVYKSLDSEVDVYEFIDNNWPKELWVEYKRILSHDYAEKEWDIEFDYVIAWQEKWFNQDIGALIEEFYAIIEKDYENLQNGVLPQRKAVGESEWSMANESTNDEMELGLMNN
jgi:hypothetical protein